jgi:hypothetical protein
MNPDLTYLYNITQVAVNEVNDLKKSFTKTMNVNKKQRNTRKTKKIPFQKGIPKLNKTRKLR